MASLAGQRRVETHLLDFVDVEGKTRHAGLLERLRPDEPLEALMAQMAIDKGRAREALASENGTRQPRR